MSDNTSTGAGLPALPPDAGAAPAATATAPAATTTTPAPAATTTAPAAAPIPWLDGADDLTVGYVQNKGWKAPGDAIKSYRELESVLGHDRAGRTVVVPKEGAPAEEMGQFYTRLGRPSDPAGYGIQAPEGADPEFSKTASQWFFDHGVSKEAAQGITAKWNEHVAALQQAEKTAWETRFNQEQNDLKQEWGLAYTQKYAQADAFFKQSGMPDNVLQVLTREMGPKATMNWLATMGAKLSEPAMHSGGTGAGGTGFGVLTPQQALSEIESLRKDKDFAGKLASGDANATEKWNSLHRYAYPTQGK